MQEYLIFADPRFRKNAAREVRELFSAMDTAASNRFFAAQTGKRDTEVLRSTGRSTFVDAAIPLVGRSRYSDGDYSKIIKELEKILKKKESFRIEVLNINSLSRENAKSIEVKIGRELEAQGYPANLDRPKTMVYLVLTRRWAFIGRLPGNKVAFGSLDPFRENKFIEGKISRAEFKLKEAFEYFSPRGKIKNVLDLGAAPGGWTNFMLKSGARVVAVDNALLDYGKLANKNFVHIKKNAQDVDSGVLREEHGLFDALLIDMNINPKISAALAQRFSDTLKKGACLILTVKLVDYRVGRHLDDVREELRGFKSIRFKKLPHNRMELTCFAVKK